MGETAVACRTCASGYRLAKDAANANTAKCLNTTISHCSIYVTSLD